MIGSLMNMCQRVKFNFTLVELLVSLGVFSILLILFMQFFSGMRLVWTNTEKSNDTNYSVRITMDLLSELLGSAYYSNSPDFSGKTVQFPFHLKRNEGDFKKMSAVYFATKASCELPGNCSVRFIGVQCPNKDNAYGFKTVVDNSNKNIDKDDLNKIYLTVISNAKEDVAGNDIKADNHEIYHCFWSSDGQFLDPANKTTPIGVKDALEKLGTKLDEKLKDPVQRIKLLDNVTEFRVRGFKADGTEITGDNVYEMPHEIEITISVLNDVDFATWSNSNFANDEFRRQKQKTFSRRIYIGDRWKVEDKYENF